MKRMLLIGLVAVVVIGGVAAYFLISNLGAIIVAAVEHFGSETTGTKVTLRDADVSTSSGEGKLIGLVVGNPQGFGTPSAFRLGEVKLRLDIASALRSDTILVHEIGITAPEITYELGAQGTDNISVIRRNVESKAATDKSAPQQKPAGGPAAKPESGKSGGEKKLIIENVTIRDAKVVAAASMVAGRQVSATLPPIQLRDIGKAKGGVTPAEAMQEIMAVLGRQVQAEVSKMGLEQLKGLAGSGATDLLNKAGAGAAGNVPDAKDAGDMLRRAINR
jgi:hypothetical protein